MSFESRLCHPIHRNGPATLPSLSSFSSFESARSEVPVRKTVFKKSSGLHILKSPSPLPIPTRTGTLLIPQLPFEEVIELINTFFEEQTLKNPQFENLSVAWITHKDKDFIYYPPAFESRGLSLKNMMFLESGFVPKTLHSVCDDNQFHAVVVVGKRSRSAEHIANKWLKRRDGPAVRKADELESQQDTERLIIFIE